MPQSGLAKFRAWIQEQNWREVLEEKSVDTKAEQLHKMLLEKLDEVCPEKMRKISNDDEAWFTGHLKRLIRWQSSGKTLARLDPGYF